MIVMLADEQILSAKQICQHCLMSDRSGLPRWRDNNLGCGKVFQEQTLKQAKVYKCQMGFNVVQID